MTYIYLTIAIVAEVVATSALKASEQFSRACPSVIVVLGYGVSFYFLARVLQELPVGITYAVWSGVGIVLVTLLSMLLYQQIPDLAAIVGMGLIITGVAVIHLFSSSVSK
ncbi:MAG: multidrug efflux SMR transporter [Desulfuromonadaceae bacterium]|jgi:small multidrug resistance pump|nr:multidrug efflux SMR transporter [Desulfuromonas sp.]MDY0184466.1 multidrug efflux SMR transporter [Desulfuromonadaceae bacterium]